MSRNQLSAVRPTEAGNGFALGGAMQALTLGAEAGQVSAELARRGMAAQTRVHVFVEITEQDDLPMAALARADGAFEWLADEPDITADADLVERAA
jgi:hypothetical protein